MFCFSLKNSYFWTVFRCLVCSGIIYCRSEFLKEKIMVNRIITEYLDNNKRLIIPELGAFIKKEGENNIVFVPFLKKDDGVLTGRLCSTYGLKTAEARALIDDYVFNLRNAVSGDGYFVIEKLGRIRSDANNIYYLEYNSGERPAKKENQAPPAPPKPRETGATVKEP